MAARIPTVSFRDNLVYNLLHIVPFYLQGIFTRNRRWVAFWSRFHPDPLGVRFGQYLRRKYRADYLYLSVLGTRTLLVLDPDGLRQVLDNSPLGYADARLKRVGMGHFQPNAVTISRSDAWKERRCFNDSVLGFNQHPHPYGDRFLAVVREEVSRHRELFDPKLEWRDFEELFDRITLRVIFGDEAVLDQTLTRTLGRLMRESNRVVGLRRSRYFEPFYKQLRYYLQNPEPNSLLALCPAVSPTAETHVENQIPHWMFAMNETLAGNTARALALVAADPDVERQVARELQGAALETAAGVDGLVYLEGCLQEAMRLWPTTPMLVRETQAPTLLGGEVVPAGVQVLILNGFNHRDAQAHSYADRFYPKLWTDRPADYRFNHLSNGMQACAGRELALFLGTAVLSALLERDRYVLLRPALDPAKPLPHSLNYFDLQFSREYRVPESRSSVSLPAETAGSACPFAG